MGTQSNKLTVDRAELAERLARYGQAHVLAFWDELDEAGRRRLGEQLAAIDFEQLAALYRHAGESQDWAALSRRAGPAAAARTAERQITAVEVKGRGTAALAGGKIGVLLVSGGQGSRLGFEHPKGMYPIGPVSGATLLEIHLQKALAAARRFGAEVPVYIMTSPATNDEQVAFLRDHEYFGLPRDDVYLFCQGTMPAVDAATGRLLLAAKDSLFLSPDGHGGTVAALAASGALADMRRRGIEHVFYLQVDNPLAPICEAELIGYHLLAKSELTSIAVAKQTPQDKLGNFATIDGRMQVIEYSDFPDDVAERRDAAGGLVFWAGSIAVHVFAVELFERALATAGGLPFHVARKKVPFVDAAGNRVEPPQPNALKFERFIFDLLPMAENALIVEYPEEEVFAPLKNAPGAERDTAEYVQRLMIAEHTKWLLAAGTRVKEGVAVEISPLWALDAEGVAARPDRPAEINQAKYLA